MSAGRWERILWIVGAILSMALSGGAQQIRVDHQQTATQQCLELVETLAVNYAQHDEEHHP